MSVAIYDPKENFLGTGNLSSYTFDFTITDPSQLLIAISDPNTGLEVARVRGTDTTILSGVQFDPINGGGVVNFINPIANGATLLIIQANDAPAQPSQFRNKGDFTLQRIELALDNLATAIQRVSYLTQRGMQMSDFDSLSQFNMMFPPGLTMAPQGIPTVNLAGNGWDAPVTWVTKPQIQAAIQAAINAALSAAAASQSASSATLSQQSSQTNAQSALTSATSAGTSATNAQQAATTATSASTTAQTAATNAAGSATAAAGSAASASGSATTATNQAGTASGAATAAQQSATNANSSATQANNAATNAAGSATAAAGSATGAANSATQAGNSASAAANSAAQAAQSASASGAPGIVGTMANPATATANTTIPFGSAAFINLLFLKGAGGAPQQMTANPQIQAGSTVGQTLEILTQDDTATVILVDGMGLDLNGTFYGQSRRILGLIWNGNTWQERFRR